MGKNKKKKDVVPSERHLDLLPPPDPYTATSLIVDTHTHLLSTFSVYRSKYPNGRFDNVWDFVSGIYYTRNVAAIIDVWCEAPVQPAWKEIADSALSAEDRATKWHGTEYWFVMGVHPHEAERYDDAVEQTILEAMTHPRCVGWGEIGLDYHYDNAPRDVQQRVFERQLRAAVRLGKPLTIHTREAEEDTERILKAEVPIEHKIHIHCFTDSPEFAQRLLAHFPNLYIGITGVITYKTNLNTAALVRQMASSLLDSRSPTPTPGTVAGSATALGPVDLDDLAPAPHPRILLETDAPYMVPSNLYTSFPGVTSRLPLCHSAMIPWTAMCVADAVGGGCRPSDVMKWSNENAQAVYGVHAVSAAINLPIPFEKLVPCLW